MARKITRSLHLKRVQAKDSERYPAIEELELHSAMAAVFEASKNVGDRHVPRREKVESGKHCIFFEEVKRKGKVVIFHAYIYTAGHTPDQVVTDFNAIKASIVAEQILDPDGNPIEVVQRVACAVFGNAIIIENARVYGAPKLIVTALRVLIRRHKNNKFPSMTLEDVPNRNFKKLAIAHGGAKKVVARINGDFVPEPETFGKTLEELFTNNKIDTKYKKISASIEVEENELLDLDAVMSLVDESEGSTGLSGITVTFTDGVTISDLESYREKCKMELTEIRPGVPSVSEIETEIINYMNRLVLADDDLVRIIDNKGMFIM